jgi:hypothetical protein
VMKPWQAMLFLVDLKSIVKRGRRACVQFIHALPLAQYCIDCCLRDTGAKAQIRACLSSVLFVPHADVMVTSLHNSSSELCCLTVCYAEAMWTAR